MGRGCGAGRIGGCDKGEEGCWEWIFGIFWRSEGEFKGGEVGLQARELGGKGVEEGTFGGVFIRLRFLHSAAVFGGFLGRRKWVLLPKLNVAFRGFVRDIWSEIHRQG